MTKFLVQMTCNVTISVCVIAAMLLFGGDTASAKNADDSKASMRTACTKRVIEMYGVSAQNIEQSPSFEMNKKGNNILNGQVDKGSEGHKKFRCIFNASNKLVDVMAMTPDGE